MIALEERLTSFKLSRKLRHAGAKQDSQEWWCEEADEGHKLYASSIASTRQANLPDLEQWSAYGCHELLERLPGAIMVSRDERDVECGLAISKSSTRYECCYQGEFSVYVDGIPSEEWIGAFPISVYDASPAEAFGKLYLWLLEHGHIKEPLK